MFGEPCTPDLVGAVPAPLDTGRERDLASQGPEVSARMVATLIPPFATIRVDTGSTRSGAVQMRFAVDPEPGQSAAWAPPLRIADAWVDYPKVV